MKLLYSLYRELQSFSQFGSDLDKDTKERLAQGERIVEVLKQGKTSPLDVEKQVVIIYAVVNNYLKNIRVEDIAEFEKDLFVYIDETHPDIFSSIRETGELTKPYGKKALIVTGRSSAKKSGLYDKVANSLSKAGIDHVLFDKVAQNPLTTTAMEGAAFA